MRTALGTQCTRCVLECRCGRRPLRIGALQTFSGDVAIAEVVSRFRWQRLIEVGVIHRLVGPLDGCFGIWPTGGWSLTKGEDMSTTARNSGGPTYRRKAPIGPIVRRWYTVPEVAEMLGYGPTKVRMMCITGDLRSLKDGGSRPPARVGRRVRRDARGRGGGGLAVAGGRTPEGSIYPYRNGFAAHVWIVTPRGRRQRQDRLREDPAGGP